MADGYEQYTPEQMARDSQADAEQILVLRKCLNSAEACGGCDTKLCPKRAKAAR